MAKKKLMVSIPFRIVQKLSNSNREMKQRVMNEGDEQTDRLEQMFLLAGCTFKYCGMDKKDLK